MENQVIKQFYLYAVMFLSLCFTVGGIIVAVNAVASYLLPTSYYNKNWEVMELDKQRSIVESDASLSVEERNKELKRLDSERIMIEQRAAEQERIDFANTKANSLRTLISAIACIVVALPIYIYHWRKTRQVV